MIGKNIKKLVGIRAIFQPFSSSYRVRTGQEKSGFGALSQEKI